MNDTDHTNDESERNRAVDMTSEEIREEALKLLRECDGAILVTANLDPDDDAVVGSSVKFVADDLDDAERYGLHGTLMEGVKRTGSSDGESGPVDGGEALAALLGALANGGTVVDESESESDESNDSNGDDGDRFGGMFA